MKYLFLTVVTVLLMVSVSSAQTKEDKRKSHEKARQQSAVNDDGTLRTVELAEDKGHKETKKETKKTKAPSTTTTTTGKKEEQ